MWEANAGNTVSAINAELRQGKPDYEEIIRKVSDLAVEVGRQNLFRQVEPGHPGPQLNRKATEVRMVLEKLQAELSARDVPKALEHGEAALRFLQPDQNIFKPSL